MDTNYDIKTGYWYTVDSDHSDFYGQGESPEASEQVFNYIKNLNVRLHIQGGMYAELPNRIVMVKSPKGKVFFFPKFDFIPDPMVIKMCNYLQIPVPPEMKE